VSESVSVCHKLYTNIPALRARSLLPLVAIVGWRVWGSNNSARSEVQGAENGKQANMQNGNGATAQRRNGATAQRQTATANSKTAYGNGHGSMGQWVNGSTGNRVRATRNLTRAHSALNSRKIKNQKPKTKPKTSPNPSFSFLRYSFTMQSLPVSLVIIVLVLGVSSQGQVDTSGISFCNQATTCTECIETDPEGPNMLYAASLPASSDECNWCGGMSVM